MLTVKVAKLLKGKRIAWMYFGYKGQNSVKEMTVGDIVTELDYNEAQPCDVFSSKHKADLYHSCCGFLRVSPGHNQAKIIPYSVSLIW